MLKYMTIPFSTGASSGTTINTINDISDVNVSTLADNQYLQYDSTTGKWKNESVTAGGGVTNIHQLNDVETYSFYDDSFLMTDDTGSTTKWRGIGRGLELRSDGTSSENNKLQLKLKTDGGLQFDGNNVEIKNAVPDFTTSNNGKVLKVVSGSLAWDTDNTSSGGGSGTTYTAGNGIVENSNNTLDIDLSTNSGLEFDNAQLKITNAVPSFGSSQINKVLKVENVASQAGDYQQLAWKEDSTSSSGSSLPSDPSFNGILKVKQDNTLEYIKLHEGLEFTTNSSSESAVSLKIDNGGSQANSLAFSSGGRLEVSNPLPNPEGSNPSADEDKLLKVNTNGSVSYEHIVAGTGLSKSGLTFSVDNPVPTLGTANQVLAVNGSANGLTWVAQSSSSSGNSIFYDAKTNGGLTMDTSNGGATEANAYLFEVDSTIIKTTGAQTITGTKTFEKIKVDNEGSTSLTTISTVKTLTITLDGTSYMIAQQDIDRDVENINFDTTISPIDGQQIVLFLKATSNKFIKYTGMTTATSGLTLKVSWLEDIELTTNDTCVMTLTYYNNTFYASCNKYATP